MNLLDGHQVHVDVPINRHQLTRFNQLQIFGCGFQDLFGFCWVKVKRHFSTAGSFDRGAFADQNVQYIRGVTTSFLADVLDFYGRLIGLEVGSKLVVEANDVLCSGLTSLEVEVEVRLVCATLLGG